MAYTSRKRTYRLLAAGYFGLMLLIVAAADSGRINELFRIVKSVPFGDTAAHFVLVGTLGFLVCLALGGRRWVLAQKSISVGALVVGALVTLEELSQVWFATRSFSLLDLGADYAGILLGCWMADRWISTRRSRLHPAAK